MSQYFAVVYVEGEEFSLACPSLLPEVALLDGSLIKSGSRYQKACSALDALAQAIEGTWARENKQRNNQKSIKAIKTLVNSLLYL